MTLLFLFRGNHIDFWKEIKQFNNRLQIYWIMRNYRTKINSEVVNSNYDA